MIFAASPIRTEAPVEVRVPSVSLNPLELKVPLVKVSAAEELRAEEAPICSIELFNVIDFVPVSEPPISSQMSARPEPLCSPKARIAPAPRLWSH